MKALTIGCFLPAILTLLLSCNTHQQQYNQIFDIYYEKYPNIHDPFTSENQLPATAFQQYEAGNYNLAITGLDSILNANPAQKFASFYLGLSYFETGEYKKAIAPLQDAIDSRSNLLVAPALFYSALAYLKLNKKEEALAQLNLIKKRHDYYYPRSRELLTLIPE